MFQLHKENIKDIKKLLVAKYLASNTCLTSKHFSAMTKNLYGITGTFFGSKERNLGINHFNLNIIDTPGFSDDKESDRRTNAQKISQSLDVGINAFLYVTKDSEFKVMGHVQDNLHYLHEWTQGSIWKNLIFLIRQDYRRVS